MTEDPVLENPERLLAAIVASTDDAISSCDADGRITTWNLAAERLYGYRPEEILGQDFSCLVPVEERSNARLREVLAGRPVAHGEATRVRKDGSTVTVGETISAIRDDGGDIVGAAIIAHDVGDRLALEHDLAEVRRTLEANNARLERSNADLEQFAYVASHDLSEPLRAIAGMVGLLARRYRGQLDSDADEFIDFAIDGCERMRTMIEDLLRYSRAGQADLRIAEADAGTIVAGAIGELSATISDTAAEIRVEPLPPVTADPRQLQQVFQNLISNAIKFAAPGRVPEVVVSASSPDDLRWRFEVADNGIGIEEKYREKIFRMFQRLHTRDEFPGTGIGLPISQRIVERHGGMMGVDANERGGSTFWFTLPRGTEATT